MGENNSKWSNPEPQIGGKKQNSSDNLKKSQQEDEGRCGEAMV